MTGYFNQQEAISEEKLCNILPGKQNISQEKSCSNISRANYNRIYKQNQRSSKAYKQKEMLNKQQVRSDKEYREKEKQRELVQKQQVRSDKEHRQKEMLQKQQVRSDKEYREKEKQRELVQKQQVRSDKEHRQKEMLQKQQVRSDKEYREKEKQRELVQKQQVRSDKEHRQKEMLQKQQVRSDKEYREKEKQKELVQKQQVRSSSKEYRAKEKQRELVQKQKVRNDPSYRQRESRNELFSKRKIRENELTREHERLTKAAKRQNSRYRQLENEITTPKKALKRKSAEYRTGEENILKSRKRGITLNECIDNFHTSISIGPVFVCTCCHQTWFNHSVQLVSGVKSVDIDLKEKCFTRKLSVNNKEWLCKTCLEKLKQNIIPKLAVINGLNFPYKPPELFLHPLEERLISLRIPFMTLYQLPSGSQLQMHGSVVNVPVDIAPTVQSLPRLPDNAATVPVSLKRKLQYKSCVYKQNVRPMTIICALHYLMTKELYKTANINLDETWIENMLNIPTNNNDDPTESELNSNKPDDSDGESDTFSEVDPDENVAGNQDTMLDEQDIDQVKTLTFAPGEGQTPMSLFQDKDAEYLSFPSIYCGERMKFEHVTNKNDKLHYSDLCKWELRAEDRRAAQSVPNLFFKAKKLQIQQVAQKGTLSMKRVQSKGSRFTAGQMLNEETQKKLTRLDEGYYIFRTIRNSPPYLNMCKKEIMAMIRQLGLPQWFMSLSAADTKWNDLIIILGKLVDNKDYTDDLRDKKLTWQEITRLVSSDPVTCARYFNDRVQKFIQNVLKSEFHPLDVVQDYVYRVEFQHRGSPHIHMVVWINGGPRYGTEPDSLIEKYIDDHVSCSVDVPQVQSQYVDMQKHKHSRSCRKKGKALCRFGFPLPPLPKTTILEPYEGDQKEKYSKLYQSIKLELDQMKDGSDLSFEDFLIQMQCTYEEYIMAIQTSLKCAKLFLRRTLKEIRVNPYMKNLIHAWRANHDIQFVLDPYACAAYITDYITKTQKGMSTLLYNACKEARNGNDSLRKQVRFMGNQFLNATEICAQEAVYLALQLPLTKKTRQVVFINTSAPEDRTRLLKSEELLKELPENSTDIYSSNELIRYTQRPKQLENWCLADYVSKLNIQYPKSTEKQTTDRKQFDDNVDDEIKINNDIDDDDILSNEDVQSGKTVINIELKNGLKIKSRKHPRVIRCVRFKEKVDPENYYREQLLLYWHWRNEQVDLLAGGESYKAHYDRIKSFLNVKKKEYDNKSDELDKAMERAENDDHDDDAIAEVAPSNAQQQNDDETAGITVSEQYAFFDPKRTVQQQNYDIGGDIGVASAVSDELLKDCIPDSEFYDMVRQLNHKQREFFIHVNQWIRTKSTPLRVFLTGGAGVGKSVVIRALYQSLHRYLISQAVDELDHLRVLRCAPTGTAAYNIEGLTIHHAFDVPVQQKFQPLIAEKANTLYNKYKHVSVLIIDEISLLSNVLFKQINDRLQQIKKNSNPFGNVHIILVGDLFQLEPVSYTWIFNNLSEGYGPLAVNLWNTYFDMYELTEIMRQKDDQKYAELLNRLREGNHTAADIKELQKRMICSSDPMYPLDAPHIFRTNAEVNSYNETVFNRAITEKTSVQASSVVVGDVTDTVRQKTFKHLQEDQKYTLHSNTGGLRTVLNLAISLHYDCTVNLDVDDGLTNGATCVLKHIEYKGESHTPAILWVEFIDSRIAKQWRQKYRNFYTSNNIAQVWTPIFAVTRTFNVFRSLVSRKQFPLCPSSARTLHKCQGYTLHSAVIHMGKRKLAQSHYTAFSRVTKIEHLYILELNEEKIAVYDSVKAEMERLRTDKQIQLCYTPVYRMPSAAYRIVFHNTRSLHAHFEDVKSDQNYTSSDVICFAETRLTSTDQDEQYNLEDFHIIRNDQKRTGNTRPPHGIGVYVKKSCTVLESSCYSTPELEYSIVVVQCVNKGIVQVIPVYRANKCSHDLLKSYMEDLMLKVDPTIPYIVFGDFNVNASTSGNMISDLERIIGCSQLVKESTTIHNTTIDLVFCNIPEATVGTIVSVHSDHKIVVVQ